MNKSYALLLILVLTSLSAKSQNQLNCSFTVPAKACVNQSVNVTYTGGASPNATYLWNFNNAVILSGTGPGPYVVKWETTGEKHITLTINFETLTCTSVKPVVVIEMPALFNMTGGGVYYPGTSGVPVGLSGSETGLFYKLLRNGQYTGVVVQGTGQHISFGPQTVPGQYTAVARADGSECMREMDGVAVVTASLPPAMPYICMVTFDTATGRNKIIWNKHPGDHVAQFNIYKETYQNNIFSKIGEVPYSNLSVYVDAGSDPLVKSDRYRISLSDSAGHESEKSPFHKTIHLNINPGILGFNLIWNHYEGFEFLTYKIHRKHGEGEWEVIDSIAGNINSYTDFYTGPGIMTYFIEVVRTEPCNPSLKSSEILSVISNTATAAPLGINDQTTSGLMVYPNPASDKLTIMVPGSLGFRVEIIRADGVFLSRSAAPGPKAEIDIRELANGLYILRILGSDTVTLRKFVKN